MIRARILIALGVGLLMASACGSSAPRPVAITDQNAICASCRAPVINQRFAAELLTPGEAPLFFNDIQCLSTYLEQNTLLPRYTIAYVVDFRTGEWIPAATAVYTRVNDLVTPMGSHLVAHESAASRDADPVALAGSNVSPAQLFPLGAPEGTR